jgi:hypothetical protein
MPPIDQPSPAETAPRVLDSVPEPEVFGALGPVLVAAFLLWIVVVAAVGSSV